MEGTLFVILISYRMINYKRKHDQMIHLILNDFDRFRKTRKEHTEHWT